MPTLRKLLLSLVLATSIFANLTSAGHLRRYAHYTRRADELSTTTIHLDGLDTISDLICTPCSDNTKRSTSSLDIPATDLSSIYTELQALKAEAINRMLAEGLTPTKRTILPFIRRREVVPVAASAELEKRDLDHLISYVCPPCPIAKRQTRVSVSVTTNIRINGIPANQLQGVLDRINAILRQVEEALRRIGLPIPVGTFPTIPPPPTPQPEEPAPIPQPEPQPPAPGPAQPTPPSEIPNPSPEQPPAPGPEEPPVEPAPIPTPSPNPDPAPTPDPAPPAPTPTTTRRETATSRITFSTRISVVTTITIRPGEGGQATTPPAATTTPPPEGSGDDCPETITVNSTTTIFE